MLEFQSWSMNNNELVVYHGNEGTILNNSLAISTEWAILNRTVIEHEVNKIIYLEFILVVKRSTNFYGKSLK